MSNICICNIYVISIYVIYMLYPYNKGHWIQGAYRWSGGSSTCSTGSCRDVTQCRARLRAKVKDSQELKVVEGVRYVVK